MKDHTWFHLYKCAGLLPSMSIAALLFCTRLKNKDIAVVVCFCMVVDTSTSMRYRR